jgi:molybdopterin synthase catalytic subunit
MIEITSESISVEEVVNKVKSGGSGCVVTYVGLIRDNSQDRPVLSVEYRDTNNTAANALREIAAEAGQRWQVNGIAITHRTGKLNVGDINLVVTVASAHRAEGFAASEYIIDRFKQKIPTEKTETYRESVIPAEES